MDVTSRRVGSSSSSSSSSSSYVFDRRSLLQTIALFFSCPVLCHSSARQQDYSTGTGCVHDINSVHQKSGTISSPYFPVSYPVDVVCRFRFVGEARERIQIIFVSVNLNYMNGDANEPLTCEKVDTVTVSTWDDRANMYSAIGVYCGSKTPPRLMSSTNRMLVTFSSLGYSSGSGTGFQASYSFVTDYGIKTGVQDQRVDCRFNYDSRRAMEGTFTSPNYPGLYPRNTTCEYRFYARPHEHIYVVFRYFDVEGIPPLCNSASLSDYLTLSEDRSVIFSGSGGGPASSSLSAAGHSGGGVSAAAAAAAASAASKEMRYCVAKEERSKRSYRSDSNFLQITFHSNEVYDAFGFEALYQFRTIRDSDAQFGSAPSLLHIRFGSASLLALTVAFHVHLLTAIISGDCPSGYHLTASAL